ncbi:hypothetical protein MBLNU230_g4432t1 [Neophaeotheca triangularis]
MEGTPSIDQLLNLVPDSPGQVLAHLEQSPELASQQDRHGYSLLHAATSYGQLDLARKLVQTYNVDPNIRDEDDETCLFNAEQVDFAKELLKLGVALNATNSDGQTAAEKLDDEDEQPLVAAYLREAGSEPAEAAASTIAQTGGANASQAAASGTVPSGDVLQHPPAMPNGVQVNLGTMQQDEAGEEPDPEFRRRIEELAARQDFEGEEGQRELRELIADAVTGLGSDGQGAATRRRVE